MPGNVVLLLNPLHAVLQIDLKVLHVHGRDEQPANLTVSKSPYPQKAKSSSGFDVRSISEQVVHLFERTLLGLRLEGPEVQRVGEVAHDEEQVELPANAAHGDGRDLADHGVESEGHHHADGDTFGAGAGVEDFGGDDP